MGDLKSISVLTYIVICSKLGMGTLHFQDKLTKVDMVLEVRDARIPFSSANPELEKLVHHKHRLLVLNKADLAAPDKQQVCYSMP